MPIEEVPIPARRKAILIGKDGKIKREIEEITGATLVVTDCVKIEGPVDGLLKAQNIVTAIARGFSPEHAFRLQDENVQIDIITMNEENEKTRKRLFARIIGRGGQSRRNIEKETNTLISVYGKTVSIIGLPDDIDLARQAIEALIEGKTHGYAYSLMKKD